MRITNDEPQCGKRTITAHEEEQHLNEDMVSLLSSMQTPIVMLDGELRIRRYTPMAEKLLCLMPTDVGCVISDLKPRINVPDLKALIGQVMSTTEPLECEVQHEDGYWYSFRVQPHKTEQGQVEGAVLQLLSINQLKMSMEEFKLARDYAEAIIETVREPLPVSYTHLDVYKRQPGYA